MIVIEMDSIQKAWKHAYESIIKDGKEIFDGNIRLKELLNITLYIYNPIKEDFLNAKNGQWMENNFTKITKIPELGNSWSYGWRLYNFQGVNQIEWVINKLKNNPDTKSATITMLQKPGLESYVPCVSTLDFKVRNNELFLSALCRSLDFGKKALYNFINLKELALRVANTINISKINLILYIVSAHVYLEDIKND